MAFSESCKISVKKINEGEDFFFNTSSSCDTPALGYPYATPSLPQSRTKAEPKPYQSAFKRALVALWFGVAGILG